MAFDIATLNTRVGWAASYNSSLGWFRDNAKSRYRTYGLNNMAGYYWYQSNISGSAWGTWNCSGYITVGAVNCETDNGPPMSNCNCNCNSNCGTAYNGQCVNCSPVYFPGECVPVMTGINCTPTHWIPAVCGQCTMSGNCDTRAWMQPNCNCYQCNCACNCGQCTECSQCIGSNGNCTSQCVSEGSGACFLAGTLVLMQDGSHKPIEEIAVGDRLARGTVVALHRPLLGGRSLFKINEIVTTGDHLFKTDIGWTAVEPSLYRYLRFGAMVEIDGKAYNLGSVDDVKPIHEATLLELHTGEQEAIDRVMTMRLPLITQLYGLVTDSGEFVIEGNYIVDGVPQ